MGDTLHPLMPDKFVVEVLDHVHPDAEVVRGLRALSEKGFQIALDGYVHEGPMTPLLVRYEVEPKYPSSSRTSRVS